MRAPGAPTLDLAPGDRIFAVITLHGPLRMVADPLGDIGLRRERTLCQRALLGELKMLLFALIRLRDLADHHDDLNKSHAYNVNRGVTRHTSIFA
jgi:hypothetical protein